MLFKNALNCKVQPILSSLLNYVKIILRIRPIKCLNFKQFIREVK